MKSILLTLLFIAFAFYSWGQIHVTLNGLQGDTVYVWRYALSNINDIYKDTVVVKDCKFIYETSNVPSAYAVIPYNAVYKRTNGGFYVAQTKFIELFSLPNERLDINANIGQYYTDYKITGNKVSEEMAISREKYKTEAIQVVKIELEMDSLKLMEVEKDQINNLFTKRGGIFERISEIKSQYVKEYPDQDLYAYLISRFSLESFAKHYPNLNINVRDGMFKDVLNNVYSNYIKLQKTNDAEQSIIKGSSAPLFSLKDQYGKIFSLSDFKGTYIILEFWGTWCDPCIQEIPQLKSFYSEYKNKLLFISIACYEDELNWKNTIEKHNLTWHQLLNTEENDVSVLFGIKGFPAKIVLDKELNIVKRYIGMDKQFYLDMEKLLN